MIEFYEIMTGKVLQTGERSESNNGQFVIDDCGNATTHKGLDCSSWLSYRDVEEV